MLNQKKVYSSPRRGIQTGLSHDAGVDTDHYTIEELHA